LREGWDNPNVFQICTLNESRTADRKRQEIGRGLRLPVDQSGERVHDPRVNRLTIIANEAYDQFARELQTEYEEDTGICFGIVPTQAFAKLVNPAPEAGAEGETLGQEVSRVIWEHLREEGYLADVSTLEKEGFKVLRLKLRYDADGKPFVTGLERVSRPTAREAPRAKPPAC